MVKKLLLILFLGVASVSFSQKTMKDLSTAPNPFVQKTTISFQSDIEQDVIISVKNVLGRTVFKKQITVREGKNSIPFSRNDLRSGMYIYAVQNNKEVISKRFVIR